MNFKVLHPNLLEKTFERVKRFLPDILRDPTMFLAMCQSRSTMLFELGSLEGVFWLSNVVIGHKATVHVVIWGKDCLGLTTPVKKNIRTLFNLLGLRRLEAYVPTMNKRACLFAERLGFHMEGVLRKFEWYNEQCVDIAVYSLLEEEV